MWLKQSTAFTFRIGPFVDSIDGVTAEIALTLARADYRLSKAGGGFSQKNETTSGAHDENGWYTCILDATDTNTLGTLDIAINESGALPVFKSFMVVPANVWDSFFGADKLQVHADEITAGLITAAAIATDAIDADAIAANAVTELQSGLATAAALTTIDDFLDTEIGAIVTATTAAAIRTALGLAAANLDTQLADIPTNAELATSQASADDATLAAIAVLNNLSAAQVNTEVDTALADYNGPTHAELTAELATADDATLAAIAALNNLSTAQVNAEVDTALVDYDGPTNAEMVTAFGTADDAILAILGAPAGASLAADIAGISAGSGLDAAATREALGLSAANLDIQLAQPFAANVTQVNGIAVTGLGTREFPWRPV